MDRDQANTFLFELLKLLQNKKGSDLFLNAGYPPAIKIDGLMTPVADKQLAPAHTVSLARAIMNDRQAAEFDATNECNFAIGPTGTWRFRVNAYRQRGNVALVLRMINSEIPSIASLGLPTVLHDIVMKKRGFVLVVGATGSGKSTTLAAMIDHRNENSRNHIITIEDPIEFVHPNKSCMVSQREVGVDSESWSAALKNTLRQAPDVILIGEIRDRETMEHAIAFSETGHLCMGTLHANNANQALDRIINFFPEERRNQVLMDLSLNMEAVVSQRLIPRKGGKGRVAAVEVMLSSPLISDLILRGDVHEIKELMKKSQPLGMQTFDQALFDLYDAEKITEIDALRNADSENELRLMMKFHSKVAHARKFGLERDMEYDKN